MTIRIYLVNDNPTFLRAVASFLARVPGVEVIGHSELGLEAMGHIADAKPDVVLLDIKLPDVSGLEVCLALRSWTEPPQIVLMALADSDAYVEMASKVDALGFVNKANFAAELPTLLARYSSLPSAGVYP